MGYQERSSDGLPSASEPVTDTDPYVTDSNESTPPLETFSEDGDTTDLAHVSTDEDDGNGSLSVPTVSTHREGETPTDEDGTSLGMIVLGVIVGLIVVVGGLFLLAVSVVFLRRKFGA